MKTAIALRIQFQLANDLVALIIVVSAGGVPFLIPNSKFIIINKVIPRIIRRINIDHLDLAQIGLLQEFQYFQIIALDIEVFTVKAAGRAVLANAICHNGTQGCRDGRICRQHRLFLIRPCKLVALLPTLHDGIGKLLPQNVKINGVFYLAVAFYLGNCIGEQLADQLNVALYTVKAVHFKVFHFHFPFRFSASYFSFVP